MTTLDELVDLATLTPHCDENVLHAPGECEVCDEYASEAQQLRIKDGINFTNEYDPNKKMCPARAKRWNGCQLWQGNTPYKTTTCQVCNSEIREGTYCVKCLLLP